MCAILQVPPELLVRYESVGLPVPSTEIKLLDIVDAVLASNTTPQREVCIRGPPVLNS